MTRMVKIPPDREDGQLKKKKKFQKLLEQPFVSISSSYLEAEEGSYDAVHAYTKSRGNGFIHPGWLSAAPVEEGAEQTFGQHLNAKCQKCNAIVGKIISISRIDHSSSVCRK